MDKDFRRDYRKMRCALLHLLLIVGGATGLKDLTINVPAVVRSGDTVTLSCHYDLEGSSLYTMQWFFNSAEFYSYIPDRNPPLKIFDVEVDIQVNDSKSNTHDVTLMNVSRQLTGMYKCEVSAGSPSYHTLIARAKMEVIDAPKTDPTIRTEKDRIAVHEKLRVNCSSGDSRPAPTITWKLNGDPITEDNEQYKIKHYLLHNNDSQSTKSIIQFEVKESMFHNGSLHLRCTASISDVYRKSTDTIITEDKPHLSPITGVKSSPYGGVNGCAGQNWPWNGNRGTAIIMAVAAATLFLMMTSTLTMTVPRNITNVPARNEPTVSR